MQITNDTNLTRVTVRGVGTNDNAETQDTSIAVNIDGEYINPGNGRAVYAGVQFKW